MYASDSDVDPDRCENGPRRASDRSIVTRPPFVFSVYAGSSVCHDCPVTTTLVRGPKTYGCLKFARTPRLSPEYCDCSCSVRAPPKKFTWRQSTETRAFSSDP